MGSGTSAADNSIISAVREWLAGCELLSEIPTGRRHIDWTDPENENFGIMPDGDVLLKKFISGGGKRQYNFTLYINKITAEDEQRLRNAAFIERLQEWCRINSVSKNLPQLPEGKNASRVEAENGMLGEISPKIKKWGKYLIQFKMIYNSTK